jgi:hypothetical protein
VDFDRFFEDSNYYSVEPAGRRVLFLPRAPGNQKIVRKDLPTRRVSNLMSKGNYTTQTPGPIRCVLNGGVRYIKTDQFISAPINVNGAARRHRVRTPDYDVLLPSLNIALQHHGIQSSPGLAGPSRTLTRAQSERQCVRQPHSTIRRRQAATQGQSIPRAVS